MLPPCFAQEVKIEKKDGVTIVHNPNEPVKKPGAPTSLEFIQDLCIGDSPTDENYMFSQIGGVMANCCTAYETTTPTHLSTNRKTVFLLSCGTGWSGDKFLKKMAA